jgi:hypothetical protein
VSEYQYFAFRAVDRPLTDHELVFAREQSTRAQISRWSFENEYHYADFRGDVNGLLRHGYDVHLHYANFGIRTIAFRLPAGLPFAKPVWSNYIGTGELTWTKDRKGAGGILSLSPFHEAGELEEIWSPGDYMDDAIEIRNGLVAGDLRALYTLWLSAAFDEQSVSPDVVEPPVPAGLADCLESCGPVLEFFGLDPIILVAASEGAPTTSEKQTHEHLFAAWVEGLSDVESRQLLRKFLIKDAAVIKAETIAAIRQSGSSSDWPTASLGRSFQDLLEKTETIRAEHEAREQKTREAAAKRQAAKKERERHNRMKEMVKEPKKWLREAEKLVDARGTANYKAAAEMLADLREAVGGDEGEKITRKHAAHLAKKHPTLNRLKSSLRKCGLLE